MASVALRHAPTVIDPSIQHFYGAGDNEQVLLELATASNMATSEASRQNNSVDTLSQTDKIRSQKFLLDIKNLPNEDWEMEVPFRHLKQRKLDELYMRAMEMDVAVHFLLS